MQKIVDSENLIGNGTFELIDMFTNPILNMEITKLDNYDEYKDYIKFQNRTFEVWRDGFGYTNATDMKPFFTCPRDNMYHMQGCRYSIASVDNKLMCIDHDKKLILHFPDNAVYHGMLSENVKMLDEKREINMVLHVITCDDHVFIDNIYAKGMNGFKWGIADTNNSYTYGFGFVDNCDNIYMQSYYYFDPKIVHLQLTKEEFMSIDINAYADGTY